jgi:hypothetical protein
MSQKFREKTKNVSEREERKNQKRRSVVKKKQNPSLCKTPSFASSSHSNSLRDDDDEKKTEIIKSIHRRRRRRRRQTRRTRKRRDEQRRRRRRRRQLVHVLHVSVKSKIGRREEEEERNSVNKMQTRVPSRVLQTMARVETKRVGERDERDELAERVGGREKSESEADARGPAVSSGSGGEV